MAAAGRAGGARHAVMEPGGPAFQPVVDRFGPEILDSRGFIVRSRLGEIVFGDPYEYEEELEEVYKRLHAESGISLRQHTGR